MWRAMSYQAHIHPSRTHPGTISLAVVDGDDEVIAAMHLGPKRARALAEDLLSAAETAMRRGGRPAPPRQPSRGTRRH
jgi:hypothetical protein